MPKAEHGSATDRGTARAVHPSKIDRIGALQGAADLLEQTAGNLNGAAPYLRLELLAQVIRREAGALHRMLETLGSIATVPACHLGTLGQTAL